MTFQDALQVTKFAIIVALAVPAVIVMAGAVFLACGGLWFLGIAYRFKERVWKKKICS